MPVDSRVRFAHHFGIGGQADEISLEGRTSIEVPWREIQQNFIAFAKFALDKDTGQYSDTKKVGILNNALEIATGKDAKEREYVKPDTLLQVHAVTNVHIPSPPEPSLEIYGNRGLRVPDILGEPGLKIRESGTTPHWFPRTREHHVAMEGQAVGNCTVASSEAAVYASLYGAALQKHRQEVEKKGEKPLPLKLPEKDAKIVEKIYQDFIAYNRYLELHKFIQDRNINQNNLGTPGDRRLLFNAYQILKQNEFRTPIYKAASDFLEETVGKKAITYFENNSKKIEKNQPIESELKDNKPKDNIFTFLLKLLITVLTFGLVNAFDDKSGLQVRGPADKNPILTQGKQESHINKANLKLKQALREPEDKIREQQSIQMQKIHARLKHLNPEPNNGLDLSAGKSSTPHHATKKPVSFTAKKTISEEPHPEKPKSGKSPRKNK